MQVWPEALRWDRPTDVLKELDIGIAIWRCSDFFPVVTCSTAAKKPNHPEKVAFNTRKSCKMADGMT